MNYNYKNTNKEKCFTIWHYKKDKISVRKAYKYMNKKIWKCGIDVT